MTVRGKYSQFKEGVLFNLFESKVNVLILVLFCYYITIIITTIIVIVMIFYGRKAATHGCTSLYKWVLRTDTMVTSNVFHYQGL